MEPVPDTVPALLMVLVSKVTNWLLPVVLTVTPAPMAITSAALPLLVTEMEPVPEIAPRLTVFAPVELLRSIVTAFGVPPVAIKPCTTPTEAADGPLT